MLVYDNIALRGNLLCGPSMVCIHVSSPYSYVSSKAVCLDTIVKCVVSIGVYTTVCVSEGSNCACMMTRASVKPAASKGISSGPVYCGLRDHGSERAAV